MPARTNQFQRLVYEIERQLAPLGAVVEESAMLPERVSREPREVDILVSLDEGHHRVRIGIECQDKSRPATKPWVEAIAKKHEELGINKTVLVSSSGFYTGARRRAESLFMSVIDIANIGRADWPTEVLRHLKVPVRDRSSEIVKIGWGFLELGPGQTRKAVSNLKGVKAELPNGSRVDLLEVVKQYGNGILKEAAAHEEGPQFAIGRLHDDLRLFRRREFIGTVRFLFMKWKHKTQYFVIRLKPIRYGNRVLAIGRTKRRGVEWTATAIVESSGVVRVRCEAPKALTTILRFAKLPKDLEHLAMDGDDLRAPTTMKKARTTMKKEKRGSKEGKGADSPSQLVDARIKELGAWRGRTLAKVRDIIHAADPEIVEEWKWVKPTNPGTPVWSHGGIVCTGETYKSVVKMTFPKGAALKDPSGLFNSSLDGNARRAIDIHEGDKVDEAALKDLIRAAVALNLKGKSKPKPRRASSKRAD